MTVTLVETSLPDLNITWTADFDSGVPDVWRLWADPRLLELWMGPPTYPAQVESHKLVPGGEVVYAMTGPAREKFAGNWRFESINPPTSLSYVDGDSDSEGGMPVTRWSINLTARPGGSRMELRYSIASRDGMDHMISMGTEEGHALTIGQMDDLLSRLPEHAAPTTLRGHSR